MGAIAQLVTRLPMGDGIIVLLAVVGIALIFLTRNWTKEIIAQLVDLLAIIRRRGFHRKPVTLIDCASKPKSDFFNTFK